MAAAVVVLAAASARADRGIDAHLYQATADGYGFFSVERADTVPAWRTGLQLALDFAYRPLWLSPSDPTTGVVRRQAMIDWQLAANLGLTLGLTRWLEAFAQIPVSAQSFSSAYGQYGDAGDPTLAVTGFYQAQPRTNIPAPGGGPLDPRLGLKARVLRVGPLGVGLLASVTLPFGDESAFLGDSGFTFRPLLVADAGAGRFSFAVNLGAIVRQTTRVYDPGGLVAGVAAPRVLLELGHELTWSVGARARLWRWLQAAVAISGNAPLAVAHPDRTIDALAGLSMSPVSDVTFSVGAGTSLLRDASRHDELRVVAAVAWAPSAPNLPSVPSERRASDETPAHATSIGRDRDGDGIPDADDRCPDDPEDRDDFEDADGCPDLDNDGDGIPDAIDHCPNQAETRNGVDDDDGCPDTTGLAGPSVTPDISEVVTFTPGSAALSRDAMALLDHVADKLLAAPSVRRVRLEGHTDDKEALTPRNYPLAQVRALAVREYLVRRGVAAERLQAVGYGSTRPRYPGRSDTARARNRRVELVVIE